MRRIVVGLAACLLPLAACTAQPATTPTPRPAAQPAVTAEGAWVRTTEGSTDPTMTGMFLTLTNPGDADVTLTAASSDVAATTQLHEMVPGQDGKQLMQEAKGGVKIPAGGHLHLKPGSYHIMLMGLRKPLPIGEQVRATLRLSTGAELAVTAPVKKFVEETDHYHGTPMTSLPRTVTPSVMPTLTPAGETMSPAATQS